MKNKFYVLLKNYLYLFFIDSRSRGGSEGRERETETEREREGCCFLICALTGAGTEPATEACVLTENQTYKL